jgi:hypothetical protein
MMEINAARRGTHHFGSDQEIEQPVTLEMIEQKPQRNRLLLKVG